MGNDCKTSFQCLFKTLDAGLHGEIAIAHGDSFENIFSQYPLEISDEGKKQLQWLFTISFMLMWGFILEVCTVCLRTHAWCPRFCHAQGIVQGYIVDSFSAIRGEEDERSTDSKTRCYICSLEKFNLQDANIK